MCIYISFVGIYLILIKPILTSGPIENHRVHKSQNISEWWIFLKFMRNGVNMLRQTHDSMLSTQYSTWNLPFVFIEWIILTADNSIQFYDAKQKILGVESESRGNSISAKYKIYTCPVFNTIIMYRWCRLKKSLENIPEQGNNLFLILMWGCVEIIDWMLRGWSTCFIFSDLSSSIIFDCVEKHAFRVVFSNLSSFFRTQSSIVECLPSN